MPYKNKKDRNRYMREYAKRPAQVAKRRIRRMTFHWYGKTPKGFHRHHPNYDSPHYFVLVTPKEHKELHKLI